MCELYRLQRMIGSKVEVPGVVLPDMVLSHLSFLLIKQLLNVQGRRC